jgi:hypothetical protein
MRALCILSVALVSATGTRLVRAQSGPRASLGEHDDDGERRRRLGWAAPDFVRLQTGGWIGAMNIATGYAFLDDVVNVSAGFGYTPGQLAGKDVFNVDATLVLRPFHVELGPRGWSLVPVEIGAGIMYAFGDQYHITLPDEYRSGYYPPTALHWLAHVGIELAWEPRHGFFTRHAVFYRATTLDTFATSYLENPDRLDLVDVLSSAIGYRVEF